MGLRGRNAQPVLDRRGRPEPKRAGRKLSRAAGVIAFIEGLKITSGMLAEKGPVPFVLRPWQRKIIRAIYGKRTLRQVLITVPRKNGKTQLAAALALAHLCGPEARHRGQVLSAAADRNQAALIFREMKALIAADDELRQRVIVRGHYKTLEDTLTGSTYEALSSDARKAHGLSPSFVVADELAQWKGRELYDKLVTGAGAHAESLLVVISTKSPDITSVMSELVRHGQNILDGIIEDKTFLPIIFAAPDKADPWDEKVWHACNPALDDFRSLEEMRATAAMAKRIPAREPSFRALYLNQEVDTAAAFLNRVDWEACKAEIDIASLYGKPCYLGVDLSSTTDLTSVELLFTSGELLSWFWLPEDGLQEAEIRDHVPYALWKRQGYLETTPGRAIDMSFVVRRMGEIASDFKVLGVAYDRYGFKTVERIMAGEGIKLPLVEWGQGWKDMSDAMNAIERMVLNRELKHDGHPILQWCVSNTVIVTDAAGNRKPAKDRSTGRIDGLVAAAMACGLASRTPAKKPSVYASRGLLVLGASA